MKEALLSPTVVRDRVGGVSRSLLYQWIREGTFPRPVTLQRTKRGRAARVAWVESEVQAWIAGTIARERGAA
jgi:predicted DNA-binding transcriptional regulator AlpA